MSTELTEVSSFTANVTVPDPGEKVTAASVKVFAQSLGDRTQYLRDQPIKNWHVDNDNFGTDSLEDIGTIPDLNLVLLGRKSDRYLYSRGWPGVYSAGTLTTAGGKSGLLRLFTDNGADTVMFTVDSAATVTKPDIWIYDGTTFTRKTTSSFAATTLFYASTHLQTPDRWIMLGGEGGTLIPAVYTSDDNGTTWTSRTVPTAGAERIYDVAKREGASPLVLAVGTDSTGTDDVSWSSSDGITWSNVAITGATDTRRIAYSSATDTWMVMSLSGATATAYRSTNDGVSWSSAGALPGDITAVTGMAAYAGTWLVLAETDYGHEIFLSRDDGTSWFPIAMLSVSAGPDPAGASLTTVPPLRYLAGRFWALFTDGATGRLAHSFGA